MSNHHRPSISTYVSRLVIVGSVIALVLVLGSGCASPLSDASFRVQQDFHNAVTQFGVVAENFAAKATIMADKKHAGQRRLQAEELAAQFEAAKDADGNLVLSPEDFAQLTAVMIEGQQAIATSETRWARISDQFQDTLDSFRAINTTTMDTAKAIHETEASVQVFAQQVTQALSGIIAVGALAL